MQQFLKLVTRSASQFPVWLCAASFINFLACFDPLYSYFPFCFYVLTSFISFSVFFYNFISFYFYFVLLQFCLCFVSFCCDFSFCFAGVLIADFQPCLTTDRFSCHPFHSSSSSTSLDSYFSPRLAALVVIRCNVIDVLMLCNCLRLLATE